LTDEQKPDLEIDGIKWTRIPGVKYGCDFCRYLGDAQKVGMTNEAALAELFKYNLWFLVYFGMRVSIANNPWWVARCLEVERGPRSHTLDLWAREHAKSTIITTAKTIQDILKNPEERVGIFSFSRPAALAFLRSIKSIFENSSLLKACFPDILYADPRAEADKWSETDGLIVKRKGFYKEATVEAWGLVEGSPVGKHYSLRVYDDIEVPDLVNSPEMMAKLKDAFDMSQNLGTIDGAHRVIGTTYHHEGLLNTLRHKATSDSKLVYATRVRPATVDGSPSGASAYLPEERLAELRINRQMFYSQQLLDPTPQGTEKLDASMLVEVNPAELPKNLFKFMTVDPAGERRSDNRQGDSWAMIVCGVEPFRDDVGASRVFVLDMMVEPMTEAEALDNVVRMYLRNGMIRQLGIEKVGISTAEIHIAKHLHAKGKALSVDNGGLVVLRPAGRNKKQRIEAALQWPLLHGKLHLCTSVPAAYRERLKLEMQKFPFWHDDALDALAYQYDLFRDFRFGKFQQAVQESEWDKAFKNNSSGPKSNSWLYV
jgi:hypothetical protein